MISNGDRITAISNASGQMIDIRGKPLSEVVEMIRGTPGSTVRLEIVPAATTNLNERRVVQVTRKQLLMKQTPP
jgi:carboxyl-terminal processing protease